MLRMHTQPDEEQGKVKMVLGRLCIKIAGRDAGKKCVIVDVIDDKFVMIDGETRRRKCNISHLEPLDTEIKITKKASHDVVKKELQKLDIAVRDTKPKKAAARPRTKRKTSEQLREQKKERKKLFTKDEQHTDAKGKKKKDVQDTQEKKAKDV